MAALDGSLPSRVLDYMYLGNLGHANNPGLLKALGINQILSVGETAMWRDGELEDWGVDNTCTVQGVQDNGIDSLTDEFERCLDFIGKCASAAINGSQQARRALTKRRPGSATRDRHSRALPGRRQSQRHHLHRRGHALSQHVSPACLLLRASTAPERHHPASPTLHIRIAEVGGASAEAESQ